jgi:hypothetical protein
MAVACQHEKSSASAEQSKGARPDVFDDRADWLKQQCQGHEYDSGPQGRNGGAIYAVLNPEDARHGSQQDVEQDGIGREQPVRIEGDMAVHRPIFEHVIRTEDRTVYERGPASNGIKAGRSEPGHWHDVEQQPARQQYEAGRPGNQSGSEYQAARGILSR